VGIFRRHDDTEDDDESMDPQSLLERGHADMAESMAGPSGAAPDPPRYGRSSEFRLTVADVFVISGRGTVVTGMVETGSVRLGSPARVERDGQVVAQTVITGIEQFREIVDEAVLGDNVGLFVEGLNRTSVQAGDVLTN
jgi:translation elongation factor EF-Tu-like GTPase